MTEARSEHPPADVEAQDIVNAQDFYDHLPASSLERLGAWERIQKTVAGRLPYRVATAYLSERTRREKAEKQIKYLESKLPCSSCGCTNGAHSDNCRESPQ